MAKTGRPSTSNARSDAFLLEMFDLSRGELKSTVARSGRIWQAVRTAHAMGSRGAGKCIAIADIGFDDTMIPAARIHPASSFPTIAAESELSRHGTAVALLVLAAAPEAQLLLVDVRQGEEFGDARVAAAVALAAKQRAVAINISGEFSTDCRPRAVGWADIDLYSEIDPDPERFSREVAAWIDNSEPYTDARCQSECCVCDAVASAADNVAVSAAAGNYYSAACPACVAGAVGVGFHRSQSILHDGNVTSQYELGNTDVENLLLPEITIEEPPGFNGTSFASPLVAGLAALLPEPRELVQMAGLAFAASPVFWLANQYRNYYERGVPERTISTLVAGFRQFTDRIPAAHQHWRHEQVTPCALCALLLADCYDNAVAVQFLNRSFDGAISLGGVAAAVAPFSHSTASNFGLVWERRADTVGELDRMASLQNAHAEYLRAIEIASGEGNIGALAFYEKHRDRVAASLRLS